MHVLQHWGDTRPPAELRIRPRLAPAAIIALAVLLSAEAVLSLYLIVVLWTTPTPGWWFSLLFSIMLVGMTLGFWAGFIVAMQAGAGRERASARWTETVHAVRDSPGVIVSRDVATSDDGSVLRFELTVRTSQASTVTGTWRPRSASPRLLQSQVPGVGASARVWRVGAAADEPAVIEALDPTVTAHADGSGIDKYAD